MSALLRGRCALTVTMLSGLLLLLPLAGCGGGDQELETDPTTTQPQDLGNVDDVEIGEDPFATPIEDTGPTAEELASAAVSAVRAGIQDVFFDFNEYTLGEEARQRLVANATLLREYPDVTVLIEGHCDERGTVQYNLALGEKRANAARDYLVSLGLSAGRISTVSYGKEKPFAMGHNEQAWAQNRRAHFVVQGVQ